MTSYRIRMCPNPMYSVLVRRDKIDTETHRIECHVNMEAETQVMHLYPRNAKDSWQPPEARSKQGSLPGLPWWSSG